MSFKKYGTGKARTLKGFRNFRVGPGDSDQAIEAFLHALDHPRALTVWLMYLNQEHRQLVDLEFDPMSYNTLSDIRGAYAATKFLSKFTGLSLDSDLDSVALKKFDEFELLCKGTNRRFHDLSADPLYRGSAVWLHNAVIRKIGLILGDFETEEFFSMPDWGPGASTLIKRRDANAAVKFQKETGITRDLHSLLPNHIFENVYPHWYNHLTAGDYPNYQVGNKVITVPKDAKTNRVIAVEPGINLWFQKSIGEAIGIRLRRVGVDLRYQSRNQKLAKLGSIDQSLATVDLSSASDSISRAVVESLLPPRWFELMNLSRSHYGTLLDKTVRWEKFSSMGNGFTFQLESLIFYAIAFCCAEFENVATHSVSSYGDDVILPTSSFNLFSKMMDFYGFVVNQKKSHFSSCFRESCGSHYFLGFDVKPIYLKDRLSSLQSVFRLANAVRRYSHRLLNYMACDKQFRTVFDHLVQKVPKALRLRIPEPLGDGGFISNFDEATPTRAKQGFEGFLVRHVQDIAERYEEDRTGYNLSMLWRLSKRQVESNRPGEFPSTLEAIRRITRDEPLTRSGYNLVPVHRTRMTLSKSVVRQWYDLGPWV